MLYKSLYKLQFYETRQASELIGGFRILETRQFRSAPFVTASKPVASMPGTSPVMERWTPVIPVGSIDTIASVSRETGFNPFSVNAKLTAIVKHPACAAA